MFKFDTTNHTAIKVCFTNADYYKAMEDRRFGTHEGMYTCPEYQAYEACRQAYYETNAYLPKEISNKLKFEMSEWKNSALAQQKPVYKIEWKLDDWSNGQAWEMSLKGKTFFIEIDKYEEKIHFYNAIDDDFAFATFSYYAYSVDLGRFYVTNGVTKLWFKFAH